MTTEAEQAAEWAAVAKERTDGGSTQVADDAATLQALAAPATPVQQTAGAAPEVDPLVLQLQEMAATQSTLMHELRTATGRISALQSSFDKLRASAAAPAPQEPALKRSEAWEGIRSEYPEFGGAVEDLLQQNLGASSRDDVQQLAGETAEQALARREYERVEFHHKGWQTTVQTPVFQAWKAAQPPEVQALGASPYSEDAIRMLDLFRAASGRSGQSAEEIAANREALLANAAHVRPGAAPNARPRLSDAEMTPDQIWAQEAAQREKRRKGE